MTATPTGKEAMQAVSNQWLEQLQAHADEGPIGEPAARDLLREVLRQRELIGELVAALQMIRDRLRAQLNVGVVSADPENEDPTHEFQEALTDIEEVIAKSQSHPTIGVE